MALSDGHLEDREIPLDLAALRKKRISSSRPVTSSPLAPLPRHLIQDEWRRFALISDCNESQEAYAEESLLEVDQDRPSPYGLPQPRSGERSDDGLPDGGSGFRAYIPPSPEKGQSLLKSPRSTPLSRMSARTLILLEVEARKVQGSNTLLDRPLQLSQIRRGSGRGQLLARPIQAFIGPLGTSRFDIIRQQSLPPFFS